jgi:anti-sigma B factor antagonist
MTNGSGIDDRPPLTTVSSWPQPGVVVVHVAGEIDASTAPLLESGLRALAAHHPEHLVLDLSRVTFMGSHGGSLLVRAARNDGGVRGRLHLVGVTENPPVERVLDVMGLTKILDIHADLGELLRALAERTG